MELQLDGLNKALAIRNGVVHAQEEIIKELRNQLERTMDRLMSRDFQELQSFSPSVIGALAPQSDNMDLEELVGMIGERPKSG